MKISFIASASAPKPYKEYYSIIINYLTRHGHNIIQSTNESDLIIAECSFPDINIGYEIAYAIQYEKEVIILKSKESKMTIATDTFYSDKNIYIYEYDQTNILSTIKEALEFSAPQKYKKFNILFSPRMIARLNLISKKKNLPKSVYIRQIIEKSLSRENMQ